MLFDFSRVQHQPSEVTTPDNRKVPAGTVSLVDGQFGKACKFSFVAATGPQFFTAGVRPSENWDEYEGFSFWVKGDGSKSYGGLEFIDGNDYALRFGYCFPIESTGWVKIAVPWNDLVPELAAPRVDAKHGYAPSKFRNVWIGKWFYWREYPACWPCSWHRGASPTLLRRPRPSCPESCRPRPTTSAPISRKATSAARRPSNPITWWTG